MSAAPAPPRIASAEGGALLASAHPVRTGWSVLPWRMVALCIVELQKIRHDRSVIYSRAIQPLLWLAVYGETFTKIHAIPTGTPEELIASLPGDYVHGASLEAAFRYYSGGAGLEEAEGGTFRDVRSTRTTANRVR